MAGIEHLDVLVDHPMALFVLWWAMCGVLHELVHVLMATALKGVGSARPFSRRTLAGVAKRCVEFDGMSTVEAAAVRHAGWMGSILIFAALCVSSTSFSKLAASGVVAAEVGLFACNHVFRPFKATTTLRRRKNKVIFLCLFMPCFHRPFTRTS